MAGRVMLWITSLPGAVPHIKSGRLRALAVSGAKRSSALPDIPTMQEAGVASYEAVSWYGMFAPAGTPREVITKINTDTRRMIQSAEVRQRFAAIGVEPLGSTPEYLAKYLGSEIAKWAGVVKSAKLRAN
jgi:tripartite-type tricarboxylate transporter receptor subunit TctC